MEIQVLVINTWHSKFNKIGEKSSFCKLCVVVVYKGEASIFKSIVDSIVEKIVQRFYTRSIFSLAWQVNQQIERVEFMSGEEISV